LIKRPRRLRKNEIIRSLVREYKVCVDDLVYPLFIKDGYKLKEEIDSMPGIFRYSIDTAIEEIKEARSYGIKSFILFGVPEEKNLECALSGIIPKALIQIKREIEDIVLIADVCMCGYTKEGHCGIVKDGVILNDESLTVLADIALSYAEAGADIVAPSDMMDGRVYEIRKKLDEHKFTDTLIMSYSVKYASSFYGPFRDAAHSAPAFGDRKTYQMDYANKREALMEIELDIEEGADIVMVKPALSYLDIIHLAKEKFNLPVAAYNVSGEYSMVKAASKMGWINEKDIVMEILTSMKRAGADIIITYHAKDVARWITCQ
jgi:porphobilinogen synthase